MEAGGRFRFISGTVKMRSAAAPSVGQNADAEASLTGRETTGLYAEPGPPGWLAITCESPTMAAWLCAAIILENVEARVDEDRLLLPAGPSFTLTDEVKSIVTVVAKTHHYWQAHVTGGEPA